MIPLYFCMLCIWVSENVILTPLASFKLAFLFCFQVWLRAMVRVKINVIKYFMKCYNNLVHVSI
jgi:hypothetical protein